MPLLSRSHRLAAPEPRAYRDQVPERSQKSAEAGRAAGRAGLFTTCANPACGSGWLHLWRRRSVPIFEGGWSCSPACTRALAEEATGRELEGRTRAEEAYRHRIPLGLLMLEQGWISSRQLREALGSQKAVGAGRLGQWLVRQQRVSEQLVTRALGLQWSCPVIPLEFHDAADLTALVPRLFVDAMGALPLRVAAGRLLYLGFEDRIDTVLAHAVERMTGLRVECGVVRESEFQPALTQMLSLSFPPAELVEASSQPELARRIAEAIERSRPVESRLVRVHDCLWLRMWRRPQSGPAPKPREVRDLICSTRSPAVLGSRARH